jgi:hypothetical protein
MKGELMHGKDFVHAMAGLSMAFEGVLLGLRLRRGIEEVNTNPTFNRRTNKT